MFVISGAAGRTGSVVADTLLAAGEEVRVLLHHPDQRDKWLARGAEVVVLALEDSTALRRALEGATGFYALLPEELGVQDFHAHRRKVADSITIAVRGSRVPHVVMLSTIAAALEKGNGPAQDLHYLEHGLGTTASRVTILRAALFQDNVLSMLPMVRKEGLYPNFLPSADIAMPTVATRDAGQFAARCLVESPRKSEVIDLIGPAYTTRQLAETLGRLAGRPVQVLDLPPAAHVEALMQGGLPREFAQAVAELYACFAAGLVTPQGDRMVRVTTPLDEVLEAASLPPPTAAPTVRSDEASVAPLRAALRGPLLLPGADGFEESCRIWNGMIRARPAMVVRPTGPADVVECVRFARERHLAIAAKCGGHNIAGTSLADGGLTVDLSRLKGVRVDREGRQAWVQAGCLLGDVDRETQAHGLATVLGFVSETGVAGLTLGGGFGYLTRKHGWTVDNLLAAEVVTADGQLVTASAGENPELFWALRGGGGNFGIVTSFTFKLHPVGPKITAGMMAWPGEQAAEVLAAFRQVTNSAPRELTLAATMRLAPPAPFIPKEWQGKPMIGVVVCHTGSRAQAEADLLPLRKVGKPIADLVVEKTYAQQQSLLDATQPKGLHYYWKSEYLPALTEPALATFRQHGAAVPSAQSQVVLFHVGGAISEREADDGAVGNRDAQYVLGIAGAWSAEDSGGARYQAWVRGAWGELKPFSTGGVYVNFLTEEEGEDRVRAAYKDNFERLGRVKAQLDPDNLFRSNKNVVPRRS